MNGLHGRFPRPVAPAAWRHAEPHSPLPAAACPFGEALRRRRHETGLSLQRVAIRAGCAKSYLSMLESGARTHPPGEDLVRRLEGVLGCAPGELVLAARWQATPDSVRRRVRELEGAQRDAAAQLRRVLDEARGKEGESGRGGEGGKRVSTALDAAWRSGRLGAVINRLAGPLGAHTHTPSTDASLPTSDFRLPTSLLPLEVPLINSVAAGYPTEFTDLSYPARVADEYVRCPDIKDPDAFAARVVGDSMEPLYREGDIVVFSPSKEVKSGMDCFVRLEPDQETTFKRVVFEAAPSPTLPLSHSPCLDPRVGEGEMGRGGENACGEEAEYIRLVPLNGAYPERVVPREMVAGLYAAVSVTRLL